MQVPSLTATLAFANPNDRVIGRTGAYANHHGKGSRSATILNRRCKNLMQRRPHQAATDTKVDCIKPECHGNPEDGTLVNGRIPERGAMFRAGWTNHNVLIMF